MTAGVRSTLNGVVFGTSRPFLFNLDTVAAAGTTQATATGLNTAPAANVTGANGTKGVRLPAAFAGKLVLVYNATATNGLKVYPATGGAINGGTANAAVSIEGKTLALFMATSTTNWAAIYTANA